MRRYSTPPPPHCCAVVVGVRNCGPVDLGEESDMTHSLSDPFLRALFLRFSTAV
jgi:hypothetical protein